MTPATSRNVDLDLPEAAGAEHGALGRRAVPRLRSPSSAPSLSLIALFDCRPSNRDLRYTGRIYRAASLVLARAWLQEGEKEQDPGSRPRPSWRAESPSVRAATQGGDHQNAALIIAMICTLSAALAAAFLPIDPPDEAIGGGGWAIALRPDRRRLRRRAGAPHQAARRTRLAGRCSRPATSACSRSACSNGSPVAPPPLTPSSPCSGSARPWVGTRSPARSPSCSSPAWSPPRRCSRFGAGAALARRGARPSPPHPVQRRARGWAGLRAEVSYHPRSAGCEAARRPSATRLKAARQRGDALTGLNGNRRACSTRRSRPSSGAAAEPRRPTSAGPSIDLDRLRGDQRPFRSPRRGSPCLRDTAAAIERALRAGGPGLSLGRRRVRAPCSPTPTSKGLSAPPSELPPRSSTPARRPTGRRSRSPGGVAEASGGRWTRASCWVARTSPCCR